MMSVQGAKVQILFCFEGHFVQRQRVTIETDDTTEILASKLIEKLSFNVDTGLYVFDVQGEVNKNAIVPILLRTEEAKHYQCAAAVYRSSTGESSKVSMRLVTRALTGVCDNCYYYSQCVVTTSSKGQPEQLNSQTPTELSETKSVFPCWMNGTFDQLQCLVFIPTAFQTTDCGTPKSGDTTRCVNVVDNLGFPQLCMDKLNVFTNKTMSFVMYYC